MPVVFAVVGLLLIVVIGLVAVGRETARLAGTARPAVFDLGEAEAWIADRLPADAQARLSHEDVRWILLADADLLEDRTAEADPAEEEPEALVVDEVDAVARILQRADEAGRGLEDEDVVAVLDARNAYLEAIGAVGPAAVPATDLAAEPTTDPAADAAEDSSSDRAG